MSQPTPGDVHVNAPLTSISIAYIQNATNFIADTVFPNIPVQKQSDLYYTYTKGDWFRTDMQLRAPGTESAGSGYTLSTDSYSAKKYALHKDIDDDTRANTDTPLDADRDATRYVTNSAMLKKDQLWATKYFAASVWTGDQTGVGSAPSTNQFLQWDVSGSDPISDITNGVITIQERTGFKPNTLVVSPHVLHTLSNHTLILDRIKYTERGIVTTDLLAALFNVDRVVVANAINNTAEEGATAAMSFIFGKHAALYYANPNPGILVPSAGYTFSWAGLLGGGALGTRMKKFRLEQIESDRIEVEMAFDFKVVAADLGLFFSGAVS